MLVLVSLGLLAVRGDPREQRAALLAGGVGVASFLLPLFLALGGIDYFIYKNVIATLLPLALAVAAGFGARRAGWPGTAALAALCSLSVGVVAATASKPKYGREDWRRAVSYLGKPAGPRAVVATPRGPASEPLELYLSGARPLGIAGAQVVEVDLLGMARRELGAIAEPRPPRPTHTRRPAPGFRLVERVETGTFTLLRFRAARPRLVTPVPLERARIDSIDAVVLLQR